MAEDQPIQIAAFVLAGLAMMLNIRLSYSSAPYALIRFRLPENLFSVFVRRMASALELWCLPSMLLGNIMDLIRTHGYKGDDEKKWLYHWQSIFWSWSNFLTFLILLYVYLTGGDQGHLTAYYGVIAVSGFVFGINMVMVYAMDYRYLPYYIAGENSFPMVTSLIHYLTTLIFGNRRKWNSDYLIVMIDIGVAIIISFVAAILWTVAFWNYTPPFGGGDPNPYWPDIVSPTLMVIVGMGLVYAIYPGIAPGMIVPFYLVDKIEMILLIATAVPPVTIAILRKHKPSWSPQNYVWHGDKRTNNSFGGWRTYTDHQGGVNDESGSSATLCNNPPKGKGEHVQVRAWIWHFFDILLVIKIPLAAIFIYSLHYRDSSLSRSIINQPKMSTALTIIFYMCHECLLAVGFPGVIGNNGATYVVLPAQYVGALFMIFLAFYSEGYIIEYKSHDPAHWPTEGMTKWSAFCYWYYFKIISLGECAFTHGFYYDKI